MSKLMHPSVLFGIAAAVVLTAGLVWARRSQRGSRATFLMRPEMGLDEMHSTFYAGSNVSRRELEKALGEISRCLGVAPGRLRPPDRFDGELAAERGWEFDDPLGGLTSIAENTLAKKGLDPKLVGRIVTVDDYVRLFATGTNIT